MKWQAPPFVFAVYCLLVLCIRTTGANQGHGVDRLNFCDLVDNPAKYDGQRVAIYGYYSYFSEISWIFCWECKDKGRTWLEIDEEKASKRLHRELSKGPKGNGVISGYFTGVFRAGGGPYGTGQYRNKFELQDLSGVKVVIRDPQKAVSAANCSCTTLR